MQHPSAPFAFPPFQPFCRETWARHANICAVLLPGEAQVSRHRWPAWMSRTVTGSIETWQPQSKVLGSIRAPTRSRNSGEQWSEQWWEQWWTVMISDFDLGAHWLANVGNNALMLFWKLKTQVPSHPKYPNSTSSIRLMVPWRKVIDTQKVIIIDTHDSTNFNVLRNSDYFSIVDDFRLRTYQLSVISMINSMIIVWNPGWSMIESITYVQCRIWTASPWQCSQWAFGAKAWSVDPFEAASWECPPWEAPITARGSPCRCYRFIDV